MLVEINEAVVQRKGALAWLRKAPSFSVSIRCQDASSPVVRIHRRRRCRVGLSYEIKDAWEDKTFLVIALKKETLEIPLHADSATIPFKFKKYRGYITARLVDKNYFALYELDRLSISNADGSPFSDIDQLSTSHSIKNNTIKRTMYDGFHYKVNIQTFETTGYSQILANPIISEAHRYTLSLFDSAVTKNSKEDDAFLKKVRCLRSSPKMFISIFFHVSLEVSRNSIVYSLYKLYTNPYYKKDLYKKITVKFIGELGEDHGALRKEFFELAGNEIVSDSRFTVENGLFDFTSVKDLQTSSEKKNCILNISDSEFYSFVGFFLGHVIFQQVQINARFSKTFYMALLKQNCEYKDITDEILKASIDWIRNNPVEEMGFVFKSGKTVTDENKEMFINEYIREETYLKRPGYSSMSYTFHKIVSDEILNFQVNEIERLFSGVAIIPVEYLKRIAIYKECSEQTPEVASFWSIMETSTEEFKKEVLRFITGSSSIQYIPGSQVESIIIEHINIPGSLPTAHTCFRRLVLYKYSSPAELREKLEMSVRENGGFHFI
ncbi:E3 ubiquitin ligase SMURF1/2 [Nematocida minor]|uniref:E3 ubiquitin ligase SMURF1/2 n=1 Tax=Nematocida minor TaxID=1912983 RepID=UPI0022211F5A|nr:E3 ubiquitin ligase SMURF1/2 [Nematocida minor]KAI5190290.1 E3 ubiquitin ligase SMURF1/2 [Nematocida minor]